MHIGSEAQALLWADCVNAVAQNLPQFLQQGKHYASSLGKDQHAGPEMCGLEEMYEAQPEAVSVAQLADEVLVIAEPGYRAHTLLTSRTQQVTITCERDAHRSEMACASAFGRILTSSREKYNVSLQPVTRESELAAPAKSVLQAVRAYGHRHGATALAHLVGISEEREREIEREKEVERERETERAFPVGTPQAETDWSDWAGALSLASAPLASQLGVTVRCCDCWRACCVVTAQPQRLAGSTAL